MEGQRKTNGSSGPKRGGRGQVSEEEEEGEREEEEGEDRDVVEDTREGAKMKLSFLVLEAIVGGNCSWQRQGHHDLWG
jgi:hypothetical protein